MRWALLSFLGSVLLACGQEVVEEQAPVGEAGAPPDDPDGGRNTASGAWHPGRATNYGPGCDYFDPAKGNCLSHKLSEYEPTWFAAVSDVSPRLWGDSPKCQAQAYGEPTCPNQGSCNRCFEVRCVSKWTTWNPDDTSDPYNDCHKGRSVVVRVTDACPHNHSNNVGKAWCTDGTDHFDLGCEAFKTIANKSVGVIHIQWRSADCSRLGPHSLSDDNPPQDPPSGGGCTDTPPDNRYSCADQARWGKCDRAWMQGFCDKSCGRC